MWKGFDVKAGKGEVELAVGWKQVWMGVDWSTL